jgi:nicotinamide mononucleotide transporter
MEFTLHEILELIAVLFGLASVWFSKKNHVAVFPTGIISTAIYVYLLYNWGLLGDMSINFYYVVISIYGWYYWQYGKNNEPSPISKLTQKDWLISLGLTLTGMLSILVLYHFTERLDAFFAPWDALTTGLFFAGMWQMAKRKVENWLFWIIGDLLSVPLYYIKGHPLTALQYAIFTILAILGWLAWRKIYHNSIVIASK